MKLSKKQVIELLDLARDYKKKSQAISDLLEVYNTYSGISVGDPMFLTLKIVDPMFYELLTDYLYGGVNSITHEGEKFDYEKGGDTEFLRYINKVYFKSSPPQNDETI